MNALLILLLFFVTNVWMCPPSYPKTCNCPCWDCEYRSRKTSVDCTDIPDLNSFLSNLEDSKLESLTIQNCTEPEPNLAKLPTFKVRRFRINHCGIESIADDALVNVSRDLVFLDLSHNALTKVPLFLGLTELERLVLKNNSITEITNTSLSSLKLLNDLDVSYNRLQHISVDAFQHQGKMRDLDFCHNELTFLEPGTFETVNIASHLYLHDNKLQRLKADTFLGLPELYSLDLTNNEISEMEPGAFNGLEVTLLSVDNNKLTSIDGVFVNTKDLHTLNLKNNSISHISNTTFNTSSTIIVLKLSDNKIRSIDPNALPNSNNIQLNNNKLTTIEGVFGNTKDLRVLELGNNSIAEVRNTDFKGITKLTYLDLLDNPIKTIAPHAFDNVYSAKVNNTTLNN